MKILADKNIPLVESAFSKLGEVIAVEKGEIDRALVRDADILLVRSETKVDAALLHDSQVKFVASPTSGIDHIDLDYLHQQNIGFAYAPGSNANSVVEYVLAALLTYSHQLEEKLAGKTLGVVGVGRIGSRVVKIGEALGMQVLKCDPPRARAESDPSFLPLDELLGCNYLTAHVPLNQTGPDATFHLFDTEKFGRMQSHCVLINTSRGSVVASRALKSALRSGQIRAAILDVWEGEPEIDVDLLQLVAIGTPHIAGYSYDGKLMGTKMIFDAACAFFEKAREWSPQQGESNPVEKLLLAESNMGEDELRKFVTQYYDILQDDGALRRVLDLPAEERGVHFWSLRRNYRRRREFLVV